MKNIFLLPVLFLSTLFFTGCDKDPAPLSLDTFDVRWYDDDNTGTQTPGDVLTFDITISATDDDPDDQYVREWEFSYTVNGQFAGVLIGDENANTNSVGADIDVEIGNLLLPGPGHLQPGDVIEFRLWAIDNHGTELEQFHRYVLE
jgi:hypothetical protein